MPQSDQNKRCPPYMALICSAISFETFGVYLKYMNIKADWCCMQNSEEGIWNWRPSYWGTVSLHASAEELSERKLLLLFIERRRVFLQDST
jgi:hypothetical protein